jgi:hypothetical protein
MKKITLTIIFSLSALILFSCADKPRTGPGGPSLVPGASKEVLAQEPDWYTNPPKEEGFIVGKGEGTSASKRGSRAKAKNDLINDLQQKSKVISEGRNEDFFKETGGDYDSEVYQQFEQIQTTVWNGVIENWTEKNSQTVVEASFDAQGNKKNIYRCYLLGEINVFLADQRLLEKMKLDKELMTAFQATQAYDKLQEDLERYKEKLGM